MVSERELRRRRLLALSGAAVASLAGCPADRNTTGPAATTPAQNENETTDLPTAGPTQTPTERPYAFRDDFEAGDFAAYRAAEGSLDPWSVETGIDGSSALVDTTANGVASLVRPTAAVLSWPDTGRVRVDVQFGSDPASRNCTIGIEAGRGTTGGKTWFDNVAVAGED